MDLRKIRNLNKKMDDIVQIASESNKKVKLVVGVDKSGKDIVEIVNSRDLVRSSDYVKIEKYIQQELGVEGRKILEMKKLYENTGIINAGEFSQDMHFSGIMSSKDYNNMANRLMIDAGRQFTDPLSKKAITTAFRKTNNGINKFISFGHASSEASRIAI